MQDEAINLKLFFHKIKIKIQQTQRFTRNENKKNFSCIKMMSERRIERMDYFFFLTAIPSSFTIDCIFMFSYFEIYFKLIFNDSVSNLSKSRSFNALERIKS
jgi:hypothetical protein